MNFKVGGSLGKRDIKTEIIETAKSYLAGEIANYIYGQSNPDTKKKWREILPHHGDLGYELYKMGTERNDSRLIGLGMGLMLSDLGDIEQWEIMRKLKEKYQKK